MSQSPLQGVEQFSHSPVHHAIASHDYAALRQILATLPALPKAGEVVTEEESAIAEENADKVSALVDRRDVPGRETPLHLAVRLGDAIAVEMLMAAGADWSLQNEQGWSALQEAVCAREDGIAMIITRYYQPLAWAKWCRRLPRITGAMRRMRDFYMEITFNFESSVIPFIGRIAPSDTYRIWKRGSNLRADMTLAGFDGFKIQRSDQSFLFLGDGTDDGIVAPGSLLVLTHKDKEVTNALEGAGAQPSEAEIAQEVAIMSRTNMYRPGLDVTQADLVPQLTWRRQEKSELVGQWKAKIYDMHHVQISVRSRRVPGAMTDEELFAAETEAQAEREDDYADLLTEEEKRQLENVLSMENLEMGEDGFDDSGSKLANQVKDTNGIIDRGSLGVDEMNPIAYENGATDTASTSRDHKKNWFSWGKKTGKSEGVKKNASVMRMHEATGNNENESLDGNSRTMNEVVDGSSKTGILHNHESSNRPSTVMKVNDTSTESAKKGKDKVPRRARGSKELSSKGKPLRLSNGNLESEYKKGLRPVLWLTPDFPLKTEELLPLLDILADKVKAVRRLRELLTTKLPAATFPVKVAIPIIPTIRVVVTFNKFEEHLTSEEFSTPLSSPAHFSDSKGKEQESLQASSSWFSWIRGSNDQSGGSSVRVDYVDDIDPFAIPSDYTWVDMKEKKRRLKAKKAKNRKSSKPASKSLEVTADGEVNQ